MKHTLSIIPDRMHHAYCFVGNTTESVSCIEQFLVETLYFPVEGNPDYWKETHDSFGIEESRKLAEIHRGRPVVWDKRIILVECNMMTHEAQNALLKVLEEPVMHTHFFIVIPKESDLLPTVRSRLECIRISQGAVQWEEGKLFLDAPLSKRLDIVTRIVEEKNKKQIDVFFQTLIFALRERMRTERRYAHIISRVMKAHEYAKARGASIKSILEHLAVSIPSKPNI